MISINIFQNVVKTIIFKVMATKFKMEVAMESARRIWRGERKLSRAHSITGNSIFHFLTKFNNLQRFLTMVVWFKTYKKKLNLIENRRRS